MKKQLAPPNSECVKVMVRLRPLDHREKSRGAVKCVDVDQEYRQIKLHKSNAEPKIFTYDAVYDMLDNQRKLYDETAFPLVESVIEGYNGTIFAYGQTGCGKTHTMVGPDKRDPELKGVIPNAFTHIFGAIDNKQENMKFLVRCSYLEIYNEGIHDLLGTNLDKKLELKETPDKAVFVKGLTTVIVKNFADIDRTMENGAINRHTAETAMNKESSRSHCIFTIYLETALKQEKGEDRIRAGKLNLVDLAGSERQSKTQAVGDRLKEASKINLSLSALGNVISSLVDGHGTHIPYRDSKLTRLLQDSLGGNTKTVMIAAVAPSTWNYEETLSTLRYASRAKNIKNKPRINEDPKDALLRQYENEINKLKEMVENLAKEKQTTIDPAEQLDKLRLLKKQTLNDKNVLSVDEMMESSVGETHKEELKKLEEERKILNFEKDIMKNELQEREKLLINEKDQKEKLEELIYDYEQQLVVGGQALEDKEKQQARQYREMQLKLRKERKKQMKLQNENQAKADEKLMVAKHYQGIEEELEEMKDVVKQLRSKYKGALSEIKDLEKEHQQQKEDMLETIRDQQRELDFCREITEIMLSEGELEKIKQKCTFDDETQTWSIPLFQIQNKTVLLPKLGKQQAKELLDNEKQNRELEFLGNGYISQKQSRQKQSAQLKNHNRSTCEPSKMKNSMSTAQMKESASLSMAGDDEQSQDTPYLGGTIKKNDSQMKMMHMEDIYGKHKFNWDKINKNKYYQDSPHRNKIFSPPPQQPKRNIQLDSIANNPLDSLAPITKAQIMFPKAKATSNTAGVAALDHLPKSKKGMLKKINSKELSSAGRVQHQHLISPMHLSGKVNAMQRTSAVQNGHDLMNAVGHSKPIYRKKSTKVLT